MPSLQQMVSRTAGWWREMLLLLLVSREEERDAFHFGKFGASRRDAKKR